MKTSKRYSVAEMSVDISLVLSSRESSGAADLFPHLVSTASPASLQTHLTSLLKKVTGASLGNLLTILSSSPELCCANGETVVPLLTKNLQRPGLGAREHRLTCQCLSLLIENSLATSEAGRTISASASSLISTILSTQSSQSLVSSLQLLTVLMRCYPGSCGQARQRIQEKIFSLVEAGGKGGRGRSVLSVLGKCLSLSCQVGGGGKEGVEHTAQYSVLLSSLVSTIHSGLQEVFHGVREVDNYVEIINQGSIVNLKSANISQRASQLVTLMELLGVVITGGFPQARKVSVESLLSVPVRVMSLEVEPADSPHSQLLSSLHSLLSCSALALLSSLLSSLGDQLASCAGHVNSLLLTGLARTRQPRVRAELYNCLSRWLEVAGLSSGVEHCAGTMVTAILSDLTPVKQKMKLQPAQRNNKQKRKKGDFSERGEEGERLDVELALAALAGLEEVVRVVGGWLQPRTQTEITRSLLASLLSPTTQPGLASGLVSCLHTLLSSPLSSSPAQISLPLLSRLLHSPGLSVQARQCLLSLNMMMQPARLTLSTDNTRTASLNTLSEETEVCSTSSQTDSQQSDHSQSEDVIITEQRMEKINQMESELRQAKQAEAKARAELLKRELEISQLKAAAVKRSSLVVGESEINGDGVVNKKKKYTYHQEDQPRSPSPVPDSCNLELSNSAKEDGDNLTVQDMLKDFSDKLNDNIMPKFTERESDSE